MFQPDGLKREYGGTRGFSVSQLPVTCCSGAPRRDRPPESRASLWLHAVCRSAGRGHGSRSRGARPGQGLGCRSVGMPAPPSAPLPVSKSLPAASVCVCVKKGGGRKWGGGGSGWQAGGGIIGNGRERKRRLLFPFLSASAISAHFR